MDETPPGNRRTSVRIDQMADGPSPLFGPRGAESKSRTGPQRAGLQSQTSHRYPRRPDAAAIAPAVRSVRGFVVPKHKLTVSNSRNVGSSHTACFAGTNGERMCSSKRISVNG